MAEGNNSIIGGEFAISHEMLSQQGNLEFVENKNDGFYYYSSGRCALYAILKDIECSFGKSGGLFLPNYLCDSVTQTAIDAEWNYDYYPIKRDFHLDINSLNISAQDKKAILLIDYFGMTDLSAEVAIIRKQYPNLIIIIDCVQAFYSLEEYDADYSFTSFRKWFPCPDGALVKKKTTDSMVKLSLNEGDWWRYKYAGNILKSFPEHVSDAIVLDLLQKGEKSLDKDYLCKWDENSKRFFLSIDTEEIKKIRLRNASFLHKKLTELNVEHLYSENVVPLFIPIMVNNRDELRKMMFDERIFAPKHWPRVSELLNGENNIYDAELSLICDQRYGIDDMIRQIDVVKQYLYYRG